MIKEKIMIFLNKFDFSVIPEQIQDTINDSYNRFIGTGYFHIIYLIGLIFLIFNYKKDKVSDKFEQDVLKRKKMFLGIYAAVVLFLSLSKIYAWFYIEATGGDFSTYWRVFWMIPLPIGIGYFLTEIIKITNIKYKKIVSFIICVIIIFISGGSFLFNSELAKTNNMYKLPDDMVDIVLYISNLEGDYKKIAGPEEFCIYTRLVDGNISLSETRHDISGVYKGSIIQLIEEKDYKNIYSYCIRQNANYLVLNNKIDSREQLEKVNFTKLYQNNTYSLYVLNHKL